MVTRSHRLALASERQRRFRQRRRHGLTVIQVEVDADIIELLIDKERWLLEADATSSKRISEAITRGLHLLFEFGVASTPRNLR
jgi:hypothetical protein